MLCRLRNTGGIKQTFSHRGAFPSRSLFQSLITRTGRRPWTELNTLVTDCLWPRVSMLSGLFTKLLPVDAHLHRALAILTIPDLLVIIRATITFSPMIPDRTLRSSCIWPPTPSSRPRCTQSVRMYVPASQLTQKIPATQGRTEGYLNRCLEMSRV